MRIDAPYSVPLGYMVYGGGLGAILAAAASILSATESPRSRALTIINDVMIRPAKATTAVIPIHSTVTNPFDSEKYLRTRLQTLFMTTTFWYAQT